MIKELRRKLLAFMMVAFTLIIVMLVAIIVVVPETQKKSEIRRSLEALSQSSEPERQMEGAPAPIGDGSVEPPEKPDGSSESGITPPENPEPPKRPESTSSGDDTLEENTDSLSGDGVGSDNPLKPQSQESADTTSSDDSSSSSDSPVPPDKPDDSMTPPEKPEGETDTNPPQEPADIADRMFRDYGGNILTIETDSTGEITSWTSEREDYYSEETVAEILSIIHKSGAEFDYKGGYYFLKHRTPSGFTYAVLDSSSSINDFERTLTWGIIGGVAAWILLFLLSLKLTKLMVKPVEEAFNKQTQFISDASHELKTPIAVIQANADVLKNEYDGNRWLDYIITETHRMDKLVKDLLYLSSVNKAVLNFTSFDLSRLVEGTVLPFEALAFEKGMVIDSDIKDNIHIKADEGEIEKLISILLSNALKYSYDNAHIRVTLTEKYKSAILKVWNEGIGIKDEDRARVFERFYRVDKARSRENGSYGLGLAMAKTIADNHRAKLTVESEYGKWAEFIFEIKTE